MSDDIVVYARDWIGTPYHHQAARKGVGCDCLGLLRGVWAELSGTALFKVAPYTPDWSEPGGEERLLRGLQSHLVEVAPDDLRPGRVMLFQMRYRSVAKHIGICARTGDAPTFIHSYQGQGVVETAFTPPWQRRLRAVFAFPEFASEKE